MRVIVKDDGIYRLGNLYSDDESTLLKLDHIDYQIERSFDDLTVGMEELENEYDLEIIEVEDRGIIDKLLAQKGIASEELDLEELLEIANGNFKADFESPIFLSHTTKKEQVYTTHKLFVGKELWDALDVDWLSLRIVTFEKPRAYLTRCEEVEGEDMWRSIHESQDNNGYTTRRVTIPSAVMNKQSKIWIKREQHQLCYRTNNPE